MPTPLMSRIDAEIACATTDEARTALRTERERYDVARQALRLQIGIVTTTNHTNPF